MKMSAAAQSKSQWEPLYAGSMPAHLYDLKSAMLF
jgi:hypothetical protein